MQNEHDNDHSDRLINFSLGTGLRRTAGSWFCQKNIHRLTWFSNNGIMAKEIDLCWLRGVSNEFSGVPYSGR